MVYKQGIDLVAMHSVAGKAVAAGGHDCWCRRNQLTTVPQATTAAGRDFRRMPLTPLPEMTPRRGFGPQGACRSRRATPVARRHETPRPACVSALLDRVR